MMSLLNHPDTFKAIYRFGFDFARVRFIKKNVLNAIVGMCMCLWGVGGTW